MVVEKKHFDLASWEEFERQLTELRAKLGNGSPHLPMLFRGQRSDQWKLATTLERRTSDKVSWRDYASLVRATMPAVQSMTSREWQEPSIKDLNAWGTEYEQVHQAPPAYDYYVYLRHHGFPSPLLDWSRSVYIAAFFAFRERSEGRAAIYAYLDNLGSGKFSTSALPRIRSLGPYVKTHPRHVLQQCQYTMCSFFEDDGWHFSSHERVFELGEQDQDVLWKFTLPSSERLKVLKRLDEANLNAYSLFPIEDALLETVALREIEFRPRSWFSPKDQS